MADETDRVTDLNIWQGSGRVQGTPEVRDVGSSRVAKFRIKVLRPYKEHDFHVYINLEAWGLMAKRVENEVFSEDRLFIEGELQEDSWTDKNDGRKRKSWKVRVEKLLVIEQAPDVEAADEIGMGSGAAAPPPPAGTDPGDQLEFEAEPTDRIPF